MRRGFDSGFSEPIVEKSVSRANRTASRVAVPLTGAGKSVRLAVAAARKEKLPPEEAVKAAAFVLLRRGGLLSAAAENSVPQNRIGRLYRDWISPLSEAQLRFAAALSEIAISQEGDFLGLLYRSLLTVGDCAKNGLYYTPPQAAAAVSLHPGETVCDPCCGSGSLLIAVLPPGTESSAVFAFDIDETALRLCEVNLALFFKDGDFRSRLEIRDAIAEDGDSPLRFDVIVANPPWGARVHRHSEDSFALILRRSLDRLKEGGRWFFILPVFYPSRVVFDCQASQPYPPRSSESLQKNFRSTARKRLSGGFIGGVLGGRMGKNQIRRQIGGGLRYSGRRRSVCRCAAAAARFYMGGVRGSAGSGDDPPSLYARLAAGRRALRVCARNCDRRRRTTDVGGSV